MLTSDHYHIQLETLQAHGRRLATSRRYETEEAAVARMLEEAKVREDLLASRAVSYVPARIAPRRYIILAGEETQTEVWIFTIQERGWHTATKRIPCELCARPDTTLSKD